jgi:hypothetical protein
MAVQRQDFHKDEDDDMGDNVKKRARIAIDVSPEMRRRIKMAALQNDLKVGEYIGRFLEENVPDEAPNTRHMQAATGQYGKDPYE